MHSCIWCMLPLCVCVCVIVCVCVCACAFTPQPLLPLPTPQLDCTACDMGYNTSTDSGATASTGASASNMCYVDFGWEDASGVVRPCAQGYYKPTLGVDPCTQCPHHSTTSITLAAIQESDCDTCLAGYGVADHGANPAKDYSVVHTSHECALCGYGTYSVGIPTDSGSPATVGGQTCAACIKPTGYTGAMVSPKVRTVRLLCQQACLARVPC